jgi:hypothetical protein
MQRRKEDGCFVLSEAVLVIVLVSMWKKLQSR